MEGPSQEDSAPEVIVIDDSSDSDTRTCTGKSTQTSSSTTAKSDAASGMIQKSLVTHPTIKDSQRKTVSFKGHVIHVVADMPTAAVEDCSDRGTTSECPHLEDVLVADTDRGTTSERPHLEDVLVADTDRGTTSERPHLEDVLVADTDRGTTSECPHLEDVLVADTDRGTTSECPHLEDVPDADTDRGTTSERPHLEDVPDADTDRGTTSERPHLEDVPDADTDRGTTSECPHLEDVPVADTDRGTTSECPHLEGVLVADPDRGTSECPHLEDVPDADTDRGTTSECPHLEVVLVADTDRGTTSECPHLEGVLVADTDRGTTSECPHLEDVPDADTDIGTTSECPHLEDVPVADTDRGTTSECPHLEDVLVADTDRGTTFECPHLEDVPDADTDRGTTSECPHLEGVPVADTDRGTTSECPHLEGVPVADTDRGTTSECPHLEGVPVADNVEGQQHDTDLTTEISQSSIIESSKAASTSDDTCSQFATTDSSTGKEDTHTDAGKEDKHTSATEKSSESKPVNSSLDSKSVGQSSDGKPRTCSLDKEAPSNGVEKGQLVIPVSSREISSHLIPSDVTGKQLKPTSTDTTSYKCDQELQSTHAPRYFIFHNKNSGSNQAVRKPGDKLTSLLQRLAAGKGGKVAVKLSTISNPRSLPAANSQAEVTRSLLGSPAGPSSAVSHHAFTEISPSISGKPTVTFSPVSQEAVSKNKLPSPADSAAKTVQSCASSQTQTSKTVGCDKVCIPVKLSQVKKPAQLLSQLQCGTQTRKSCPIRTSLVQTTPTEASRKIGGQVFRVFGNVDDSKKLPNSLATPATPLLPADKIKYVLSYLPLEGSKTSNIVFAGPEGQNIMLAKAGEPYLQPSGVQHTTRKPKYQFSLLQNIAAKAPETAQMNVSMQAGIRKPPTVQSFLNFLSSPSKTAPPLKSTTHSVPETAGASTPLSGLTSKVILQDSAKLSTCPNTDHNKQANTLKRQYQRTNAGQIFLQPLSQPVVVATSTDMSSSGVTTITLSKLAATLSASKVPISTSHMASSFPSTTSSASIFVMPTAVLSPPVPTILAPSSSTGSKQHSPAGLVTSNITATSNQSDTVKANVLVSKTQEVNTTAQSSANTVYNFSDLISRFALQSVPSTSTNKPSTNVSSSMQALNIRLLQQLWQKNPQLGEASVRIIVSQGSSLKSAATVTGAQSEAPVFSQCGTITTPAGKTITLSKITHGSATAAETISKQLPKLIYPKPVTTEALIVAPVKSKGVSLLPISLAAKNQITAPSGGDAAVANRATKNQITAPSDANRARKTHSIKRRKLQDHIVEATGLKEKSTNNATQNLSSKKVKVSANATMAKKPRSAVYTAIVRTGQGPVSVRVVAPDIDDDSSDAMSDASFSNVMPEESVLATEDPTAMAVGVGDGPSDQSCESDMSHLVSCEELTLSGQETQDSCMRDDAVLNTELQEGGSSMESQQSQHQGQDMSGEETDTDAEVTIMEEQDMSVLRQLLTKMGAKSPFDSETTENIHQFCTPSDLGDLSNGRNQSGNALSPGHEGLSLNMSSTENNSPVDHGITEKYADVESSDLKIESVFSLRDSGDIEDTKLPADDHICEELPDDQTKLLPVFNVRTSDDWKSFLSPCFVVLERLSKSKLCAGGGSKTASRCSGHCRKRTLDYLCNLNLLRCVNHPDPLLFLKSKPKRGSAKTTQRKLIKQEAIKEMFEHFYVQKAASEPSMVEKAADITKTMSKFSSGVKETCVKADVGKLPSAMKEICVHKDVGKSSSLVKEIYVNKDDGKSPVVVKEIFVNKDGDKSSSLVKEIYVDKDVGKSPSMVKEIYVNKDIGTSPSMVKEIYVNKDVGKSPSFVKEIYVNKDVGKTPSVVKEVYVNKDVGKTPSVVKEVYVNKDVGKSPSFVKEIYVNKDVGKSPSVAKETHAQKAMNEPASMVKVTSLKKPLNILSLKTTEAGIKGSVNELHVKQACVTETMSKSPPVMKEQSVKDNMSKLFEQVQEASSVTGAMSKSSPMITEICVNEDVSKSLPQSSPLLTSLNERTDGLYFQRVINWTRRPVLHSLSDKQSHKLAEKPFISDTVQLSATSYSDQVEQISTAQDDQKSKDKTSANLDSICSGRNSSKFNRALKQLQKQVNGKRATMLVEKLSRKKPRRPQMKDNARSCKIKLAGQKHKSKVAVKKFRRNLIKNLLLPTETANILSKSKGHFKRKISGKAARKLSINSLPVSDHDISRDRSLDTMLPQEKKTFSTETPGVNTASDPRITDLPNVQNQDVKSKDRFVRLQPKVPGFPQEKINAALHSLSSYLAATGRKPTTGNTQYILLKIDDQHVLVKWPDISMPTSQQSSTTMSNIRITPLANSSQISVNTDVNKQHQNEAMSTTAATISNNDSNPIKSVISTSTLSAIRAIVSSTFTTTNPTSNITFATSILKPTSETSGLTFTTSKSLGVGKKEFRIIRTKHDVISSSDKMPACSAPTPSASIQQNVGNVNVVKENTAAGLPNLTNSTLKTGPSLNKQTVISLLTSSVLKQSHSKAPTAYVRSVSSTASPIVTSVISSPVVSNQAFGSKPGSQDTSITLSRLPPNSMLLPGRKRPDVVLSEDERWAKRRRLEAKYPLPPGIVIKCEPDDPQEDLTSGLSPAFSTNTSSLPTEHTGSPEPLLMSTNDQVWSVENSVNIGSYLTDTGHPTPAHARDLVVQDIALHSAVEDNPSESSLNAEDSSDGQDEPPALLDETIDDADDMQIEDITDAQEDIPPVLQPMFTSSSSSLLKDADDQESDSTEFIPEMPADLTTYVPYNRHVVTARASGPSADSASTTSLYSDSSIDSGIDTSFPCTSFSHTSTHGSIADRSVSKNLKIQYLRELLKKKEMEIENMKRAQSELSPTDFDI